MSRVSVRYDLAGSRLGRLLASAVACSPMWSRRPRATEHQHGDWMDNAVFENVRLNAAALRASTPIMADAVKHGTEIVGGVYDLSTGIVTLL